MGECRKEGSQADSGGLTPSRPSGGVTELAPNNRTSILSQMRDTSPIHHAACPMDQKHVQKGGKGIEHTDRRRKVKETEVVRPGQFWELFETDGESK